MNTAPNKWVEVDTEKDTVADVCVRTLRNRFDAILEHLPRAADQADQDVEHVHQLRVWSRRANSALCLYEDLLPGRRFRWMKKQLKRIRRAANDARDCDVLLARLRDKPANDAYESWRKASCTERLRAQVSIIAIRDRLERRRFVHKIDKLLERVRWRGEDSTNGHPGLFQDWAQERLRILVKRFFDAVPLDQSDESALHQFRIRGKELRYGVELLSGVFPAALRTNLYPIIESIQDKLGDINDLATAVARLEHHAETAKGDLAAAPWRSLLAVEQSLLDKARQEFWKWFTPQFVANLLNAFTAILLTLAQA